MVCRSKKCLQEYDDSYAFCPYCGISSAPQQRTKHRRENGTGSVYKRSDLTGRPWVATTPEAFQNSFKLSKRYKDALAAINEKLPEDKQIRELTAHKCRHTYATYLLKGGANLRQVQQLLGHSTVSVTEIYTHIDTDDVKKSVTKLPY